MSIKKSSRPADDMLPPHSEPLERGLLGCCLLSAGAVKKCVGRFNGTQPFYLTRHADLWRLLCTMAKDGTPIDLLTVQTKFKGDDTREFLGSLMDATPAAASVDYYLNAVWEFHQRREAIATATEFQVLLRDPNVRFETALDGLRNSVGVLADNAGVKLVEGFTIRRPDEILALKFDDSDRILGDRLLATGQSLVVAGAGGMGKSRLLLQLAVACITGKPFVSFETRGEHLRWLILQAENSNRRLQFDLAKLREWTGDSAWQRVNEQLLIHTLETDNDGFVSLENPSMFNRLGDVIGETEPHIIAFDSLYNFGIGDLSKDLDMLETCTAISRLAKAGNPGRAVIALHHALTGKAGALKATGFDRSSFGRNSKALLAWARGQINIAPGTANNNDTLVLSCGKCSNGKEFPPFAVRLNQASMIYELAPDFDLAAWQSDISGTRDREPLMTPNRVRELCTGPMSKAELAHAIREDCGCARQVSYRYIVKAEKAGKIRFNKNNENFTAR